MLRTPRGDLERELRDLEFAKLYGAAQAKSEFAVTLARARGRSGLTQKELADRLGRSQPYIAKLEGGEANPTLGTVGSLLAMLGFRLMTRAEPLLAQPTTPIPESIRNLETADVSGVWHRDTFDNAAHSSFVWGPQRRSVASEQHALKQEAACAA